MKPYHYRSFFKWINLERIWYQNIQKETIFFIIIISESIWTVWSVFCCIIITLNRITILPSRSQRKRCSFCDPDLPENGIKIFWIVKSFDFFWISHTSKFIPFTRTAIKWTASSQSFQDFSRFTLNESGRHEKNVPKFSKKRRFGTVPFLAVYWFCHYRVHRVELPQICQNQLETFEQIDFKRLLTHKNLKFMNFPWWYAH